MRGTVPALAPVPWHVGQGPSPVSRSATVVPSIASLKLSVVSVSTSAPRRGRFCAVVRPPPNTPPNRSPRRPLASPAPLKMSPRSKPPKPPLCPGRLPETAAEQRARLVVFLAPLLVGQHRVRLGDLLEPLLGRGVALVRVRVVLAGQLAVRRLDLGRLRGLGDPQGLVVILLEVVLCAHTLCPLASGALFRRRLPSSLVPRSSVQAAPRPVGSRACSRRRRRPFSSLMGASLGLSCLPRRPATRLRCCCRLGRSQVPRRRPGRAAGSSPRPCNRAAGSRRTCPRRHRMNRNGSVPRGSSGRTGRPCLRTSPGRAGRAPPAASQRPT